MEGEVRGPRKYAKENGGCPSRGSGQRRVWRLLGG